MKISMHATKPMDTEFTLTATMSMAHWKELLKEIDGSSRQPIWELKAEIRKAIAMVEKEFMVEEGPHKWTGWCDCAPGKCSGGEIMSCRKNSPLAPPAFDDHT